LTMAIDAVIAEDPRAREPRNCGLSGRPLLKKREKWCTPRYLMSETTKATLLTHIGPTRHPQLIDASVKDSSSRTAQVDVAHPPNIGCHGRILAPLHTATARSTRCHANREARERRGKPKTADCPAGHFSKSVRSGAPQLIDVSDNQSTTPRADGAHPPDRAHPPPSGVEMRERGGPAPIDSTFGPFLGVFAGHFVHQDNSNNALRRIQTIVRVAGRCFFLSG
jgi:hypothetical protein